MNGLKRHQLARKFIYVQDLALDHWSIIDERSMKLYEAIGRAYLMQENAQGELQRERSRAVRSDLAKRLCSRNAVSCRLNTQAFAVGRQFS